MSNQLLEVVQPANARQASYIWLIAKPDNPYPPEFSRELADRSGLAVLVIDCGNLLQPVALQQILKNAAPGVIVLDSSYTLPVHNSSPPTWVQLYSHYLIYFLNEQFRATVKAEVKYILHTAERSVWEQVNRNIDFGCRSGRGKVTPFAKALLRPVDGEQDWDKLLKVLCEV